MPIISSFLGVPTTLTISKKCSRLLPPTNNGLPLIISSTTHATDHKSICVVYPMAPNINSGAL